MNMINVTATNDDDDGGGDDDSSRYSPQQEKTLAIIIIPSAFLSVIGSVIIVSMVSRAKKRNPYKRILMGLSIADIIYSSIYVIQPFFLPQDTTSNFEWSIGNAMTCNAMGFLGQCSVSAFFYNFTLSFYYLLSIRFGVRDQAFGRRYEPYLHALSIGYPLFFAILGAVWGMYGEIDTLPICFLDDGPSWVIALASGIPRLFLFVLVIINNVVIYVYVKRTTKRSQRYGAASIAVTTPPSVIIRSKNKSDLGGSPGEFTNAEQQRIQNASMIADNNVKQVVRSSTATSVVDDAAQRRIREVAIQSFLYVGFLALTLLPVIALGMLGDLELSADTRFPMAVIATVLHPLQGFFNVFVYGRPRFIARRIRYPNETRLQTICGTFFESTIPQAPQQQSQKTKKISTQGS